ncbi:MAG: NAD(P)/FAD-dependent oxidoreductase [Planctomycetota bacterium]|jgi:glycine/D-amino acid oxidase-like deaminating enzyme
MDDQEDTDLAEKGQTRCSRRSFLKTGGVAGLTLAYFGSADPLLRNDTWEPNESYWLSTMDDPPRYRQLTGRRKADVTIIGGGLTGLSAAYHIKTKFPELNVVLLEARELGFGASGRTGGELLEYNANDEVLPGTKDNIRFTTRLIREQGLACDLQGDLLNPYKLVVELGRLCSRIGVEIFEESAINDIDDGRTIRLEGGRFEVNCGTVVLATNAYTPRLGLFNRELVPIHTACIVTEQISDGFDSIPASFSEHIRGGSDYFWGRKLPDGRLLFGGGLRYSYDNGLAFSGARNLYPVLAEALLRMYPQAVGANVQYQWNGPMAFFSDLNPRLGRHGEHDNIYFGLGYAGIGITMAVRFGHFIAEMLDGYQPPVGLQRPAQWLPGEPIRYMGVNAALHLVDLGVVRV